MLFHKKTARSSFLQDIVIFKGFYEKKYPPWLFIFIAYGLCLLMGISAVWDNDSMGIMIFMAVVLLGVFAFTWWWLHTFATIEITDTHISGPRADQLFQRTTIALKKIDIPNCQVRSMVATWRQFHDVVSLDGTKIRLIQGLLGQKKVSEILKTLNIRT